MPDGCLWREWEPDAVARLEEAVRQVEDAALDALDIPPPLDCSLWPEQDNNIKFAEGTPAPGPFRHSTSPYLREILFTLSPDYPAQHVVVKKCAQSGGTVVADIMLAAILTNQTAPAMMIQPTIDQSKRWAEKKFWPLVDASPALSPDQGGSVVPRRDRSTGGSTSQDIKFRNGSFIMLAGAESPNTLRQHTIQIMVRDDISGWTDNAGGEGHPIKLSDNRIAICMDLGIAKLFDVSTPLILRTCEITRRYQASDRRRWYSGCIGCEARHDWDWEDVRKAAEAPFNAHVVCSECGTIHEPSDKRDMLARGMWIPTRPIDGVKPPKTIRTDAEAREWKDREMGAWAHRPGFDITGFMNRYANWNVLAEEEAEIGGDPEREKTFLNTKLGRAFDLKTETPDWEALAARRQPDFHKGDGAHGPLVFTLSVDVQRDGLYWLIKGYDEEERGWYLDWGFAAGETADGGRGAWPKLSAIAERGAPMPNGVCVPFDFIGVDGRYNTDAVHQWVRRNPVAKVLVGDPGWKKNIIDRAHQAEVSRTGRKRRFGVKTWHVGTWTAKSIVIGRYARTLEKVGESGPPPGFCFFPAEADEALFQQLTAEHLHEEINKKTGVLQQSWKAVGANHWFDCDVYSLAGIAFLGARRGRYGTWTEEQWTERARELAVLLAGSGPAQDDLFDGGARPDRPATPPPSRDPAASAADVLARMARRNKE
ncbi:hypothetical protein FKB34_01855 [Glycocaulis profundi]|nr:hypothetical protein FKB34_01855 [Glycocaulis profundi]